MKNSVFTFSAIATAFFFTGCTTYTPGASVDERVVQRYEQNIMLPTDDAVASGGKFLKHAVVDVCTLGLGEMWYGRVRSTYSAVVARRNEDTQAEAAWAAFRQAHVGLTRNQLIVELGTPDAIESDGGNGKLLVYENSMRENTTFINLFKSMYGGGLLSVGKASYTRGSVSSQEFARISRIWFAVGADDKVYAVNRREKTDHR